MAQIVTSIIGLVVLALFLLFSVQRLAPAIEADLSDRSSEALADQGMAWAEVTLDGRESTLSGEAPNAGLRQQAAEIADVWGVRTIRNRLTVARVVTPTVEVGPPEPQPEPEPVQPISTELNAKDCQEELNRLLSNRQIQFQSGSAEIKQDSHSLLGELADVAQRCASGQIEIEGHTDSVGNEDSNQRLSEERAKAILGHLTSLGLEESRLSAAGYGESRPIADNSTEAGRAKNRRIEFTLGGQ